MQPITRPSKETAEALVMKWFDTRGARDPTARAYAILNDEDQTIPAGVVEAVENYDVTAVRWSERQAVQEQLAA